MTVYVNLVLQERLEVEGHVQIVQVESMLWLGLYLVVCAPVVSG